MTTSGMPGLLRGAWALVGSAMLFGIIRFYDAFSSGVLLAEFVAPDPEKLLALLGVFFVAMENQHKLNDIRDKYLDRRASNAADRAAIHYNDWWSLQFATHLAFLALVIGLFLAGPLLLGWAYLGLWVLHTVGMRRDFLEAFQFE